MFEDTQILISSSNQGIQQLKHSGYAVVEEKKGPDTYLIRIGSDKVTIKTTDDSLHEGESIRYQIKNNHLIIEKKNHQLNCDSPRHNDSFSLEKPDENNSVKIIIGSIIDRLEHSNKPDLAIINEIESVLNSFKSKIEKIDPETLETIRTLLEELKGKTITESDRTRLTELLQRIENSCDKLIHSTEIKDCRFIGLIEKTIPEGIYSFSSVFKTDNLSDIFSEFQINFPQNSDNFLFFRAIHSQDNNTIAIALSPQDLITELTTLNSLFSSPAMKTIPAQVYEKILSERGHIQISALKILDDFFMSSGSITFPSTRAGSRAAQIETLTQWFRTVLDFDTRTEMIASRCPFSTPSSIAVSIKKSDEPFLPGIGHEIPGITHEMLKESTDKSKAVSYVAEKLGYNYESGILDSTNQKSLDYSDTTSLKKVLLSLITTNNLPFGYGDSSELYNKLNSYINKYNTVITDSIEFALKTVNTQADSSHEFSGQNHDQFSAKSIETLSKKTAASFFEISNLINEHSSPQKDLLPGLHSSLSLLKDALIRCNSSVLDILRLLSSELKSDSFSDPGNYHEDIFGKINRSEELQKELKLIIKDLVSFSDVHKHAQSGDSLKSQIRNDSLSYPLLLRDSAESVLSRLESLQLLARNTHTPEGDQQILALPMKISGEWTEVNIRFVKKKIQKKQQNHKQQYSVFLNVSPGSTGAISVKMDYTIKKTLKLEMEFEQKRVKEWFDQNRDKFQDILINIGFTSVLYHTTSQKKSRESVFQSDISSGGDVDLKI
ncbi:MAG TPA: hypothetical protein VKY57_05255 [Chitinispirillaceae bacterium]|nr:hypothetical protein [Chitinispirillaceae bacterium]